jgi:hypothetical protein
VFLFVLNPAGVPPEPSTATKNLAICWFQFLMTVKEFTKYGAWRMDIILFLFSRFFFLLNSVFIFICSTPREEAKHYSIAFAVNELFPSDLSTLEEEDVEAKLGIHNRLHVALILQTCRQSGESDE